MKKMNLPNQITMLRIILVPVFMALFATGHNLSALVVFLLASISDWLDGLLARKWNLITNFGKLMDPLADKILVTAALVMLTEVKILPSWVTVLILSREFLVTGVRVIAAAEGTVIAASFLGKIKTVTQMTAILILLFSLSFQNTVPKLLCDFGIYVAAFFTLVSGIDYIVKNRKVFYNQ